MNFVYPNVLWSLFALAIPIIIHLFNFKRYKTHYFSSLQFLLRIDQQTKSTQKLRNWLILLLRLLAFTAVIFAFAQPHFQGSATRVGNNDLLAIHIDNSFSMTMKGAEGELLSEAKETARNIISKSPLSTRFLISTNQLNGIESHLKSKIEALDYIDNVEASSMSKSFDAVVNWQKQAITNLTLQGYELRNIRHLVLSDFQKSTTRFSSLQADSTAQYYPIQFSPQRKTNVSVDSVWFSQPLIKSGNTNELNVKLTNHGPSSIENLEVHIEIDKITRDLFVDVEANKSTVTAITFNEGNPGYKAGKVSISDNQFTADDELYFSYEVRQQSNVLILQSEAGYPRMAQLYQLDNFYSVQQVQQLSFTQDMLNDKDLVILNGVNEISTGLTARLVDFLSSGGTVAVFPSEDINSSVNNFLTQAGLPLLGSLSKQSVRIAKLNYKDPFFYGVFEKEKENLSLPGVTAYYQSQASNSSRALPIIQLQNGQSLLWRGSGNYSCYLMTTPLNASSGSFMSDILFPTALLRIGETSQRKLPLFLTIGQTSNFPLYYTPSSDDKAVHLRSLDIDFIPRSIRETNRLLIDISGQDAVEQLFSGNYTVGDDEVLAKISLNYDRKESDISLYDSKTVTDSLITKGLANVKISQIDQGASFAQIDLEKPVSIWKYFVILALIFLLAEMFIVLFWKPKQVKLTN